MLQKSSVLQMEWKLNLWLRLPLMSNLDTIYSQIFLNALSCNICRLLPFPESRVDSRVQFHVVFFLWCSLACFRCFSVSHVRETVVAWNRVRVPSIETSVGSPKAPVSMEERISSVILSHHRGIKGHLNYLLIIRNNNHCKSSLPKERSYT